MDGFTEALINDYQRDRTISQHAMRLKDEQIAELTRRVTFLETTISYLQAEGERRERGNRSTVSGAA